MTYKEKLATIVRKTLEHTENGNIEWSLIERDEHENGVFAAVLGEKTLRLGYHYSYGYDGEPGIDLELSIYGNNGERVESIRDTTLNEVPVAVRGYSGWYALMASLYDGVQRKVSGTERVVDEVLSQLDDLLPF